MIFEKSRVILEPMAEKPITSTPAPSDDLLTKLSNRLNDVEAKMEAAKAENQKSYVDHAFLDAKLVEYKKDREGLLATIKELTEKLNALKPATPPAPTTPPNVPQDNDPSGLGIINALE